MGRTASSIRDSLAVLAAMTALAGFAAAAHADDKDAGVTVNGITLYGTVDLGVQYLTHGAPISDYYGSGSEDLISKNSNKPVWGATPNNLSQSKIGIKGVEEIVPGVDAVFKLETYFNPTTGQLSDGLKSMTLNNGLAPAQQTSNGDSSVAGQMFQGAAYVGANSAKLGTVTFGRQNSLIADNIAKYDPQETSNAFSLLGYTGLMAGGGDTENRRLDDSVKYVGQFGPARVAGLYKFSGGNRFGAFDGSAGRAYSFDVGADYAHASIDAVYSHVQDAVSASPLGVGAATSAGTLAWAIAQGYSANNSLSATASDNTAYGVMGSYDLGGPKLFAGYEHVTYANPSGGIANGSTTIGGYTLAYVNNNNYAKHRDVNIAWTGMRYSVTPRLVLAGAYYYADQNAYAASGANVGCTSSRASNCSGGEQFASLSATYHVSKRFDVYGGAMWSNAYDGMASGYLHNSVIDPTVGVRFTF